MAELNPKSYDEGPSIEGPSIGGLVPPYPAVDFRVVALI